MSPNLPLVSIIIVNWNGKQWLESCLGSLSKQYYKNIEIIVVDNGSTDGTVEFLKNDFLWWTPKTGQQPAPQLGWL